LKAVRLGGCPQLQLKNMTEDLKKTQIAIIVICLLIAVPLIWRRKSTSILTIISVVLKQWVSFLICCG
jgi:hypothetical protein